MDKAFNLLDEKWVMVHKAGVLKEVSLKEAFYNAHEYDSLAGELATQDVAVLRVMLAVLYGAIRGKISTYEDAISIWKGIFAKRRFDNEFIDSYLDTWQDHFWLFHPTAPFFQVAELETVGKSKGGKEKGTIPKLVADIPSQDDRRWFSNKFGKNLESVTFAQAARWLIHLQAWDYSGVKSNTVGGTFKGDGGTGWCGKLGIVYVVGKNLFETLLYNFALTNSSELLTINPPTWELPSKTPAKETIEPNSYVDLLTLQSRRVRLIHDGDIVTGVINSYGDVFNKENRRIEQMSGWYLSTQKGVGRIPTTHNPSRSMWRDLGAILPQKSEGEKRTRPPIVDWVSQRVDCEQIVHLCSVGYEYGTMMSIVKSMIYDTIDINASLLNNLGADWADEIIHMLLRTEKMVKALGRLANRIAQSAGCREPKHAQAVEEQAYYSLDQPFRKWLREIDPNADIDETCHLWIETAEKIVRSMGNDLVNSASDQAFIGRNIEVSKGKFGHMNTSIAQIKFWSSIKRIVGGE